MFHNVQQFQEYLPDCMHDQMTERTNKWMNEFPGAFLFILEKVK